MRYWVYINDEVLPQPYEAEALSSIPGFDAQTLICPEETPEGGNQEWTSAGELINYGAQDAVHTEETVETAQNDEQDIYDASGEYTPEPLPESYGREDSAEAYSQKEQILLDKIEYLINEVAELKKDIANLNYTASMTMYNSSTSAGEKKNVPLVKDALALKAFQEEPLIPMNEGDIPEEKIALSKIHQTNEGEPVVLKASADDNLPKEIPDSDDILESAIENTMRLKAVPANSGAPVAFDLASKETIEISSPEEKKSSEEEKPAEEPSEEKKQENKVEGKTLKEKEVKAEEAPQEESEPEKVEEEKEFPAKETTKQEDTVTDVKSEPEDVEAEAEILEVASVGNREEEAILKTFAEEKKEEEKKKEKADKELEEIEKSLERDIDAIAEPVEEESKEPAFEQLSAEEVEAPEQSYPAAEEHPQEEAFEQETPVEEPALPVQEEAVAEQEEVPAQASATNGEEEQVNSLEELTTPPAGEQVSQPEQGEEPAGTMQVDNVDDKFLKTFTSSIEEVFLDQPTSIISDYVPPTIASQDNPLYDENDATAPAAPKPGVEAQAGMADLKNQPAAAEDSSSVRQVKRIKPAAIKTVPMVAAGDPIGADYNTPNIEEAIAELSNPSPFMKGLKAFGLMMVLLCAVLGFVAVLAMMGILPKEMSPVHYIIDKVSGPAVEETLDLEGETAVQEEPEESPEEMVANNIIANVKNYTFVDGSTLEQKINAAHSNFSQLIQWSAEPSVDPSYYSIAVKLPPNNEGYSLTYRFSYNTTDGSLTPTTSESNNIMTFIVPPAMMQQQAANTAAAPVAAAQAPAGGPRPSSARGR